MGLEVQENRVKILKKLAVAIIDLESEVIELDYLLEDQIGKEPDVLGLSSGFIQPMYMQKESLSSIVNELLKSFSIKSFEASEIDPEQDYTIDLDYLYEES